MAEYKDFSIFQNSTKIYKLIFKKNGIYIDITDWKIYFTVKENKTDTDNNAKINKTITAHSDAINGETLISLSTSDTNLSGTYYYEISYLDDEGNQDVLLSGRMTFKKPTLQSRS